MPIGKFWIRDPYALTPEVDCQCIDTARMPFSMPNYMLKTQTKPEWNDFKVLTINSTTYLHSQHTE